jgi:threonine/homoserine/homoserine lactone efflux protein
MAGSLLPQLVAKLAAHELTQIGLAIAALGALAFIWGAGTMVVANRSYHGPSEGQHRSEKVAHLVGAILLTIGFGLQLAGFLQR